MSKSLDTLVEDIYELFNGHDVDPDRAEEFGRAIATAVSTRLSEYKKEREFTLRVSNLGKPDRQLWYDKNKPEKEELAPHTKIKFMFGDLIEALLLFLAAEAGHTVTDQQTEVIVDGIVGHNDAVIDDVVVDVKSASTHAFKKFRDGTLSDDDPFGYMEQMAGYSEGLGKRDGAFLAMDKQNGHITLLRVPREELEALDVRARIEHLKAVVDQPEPPERCYEPVPEGQSGNMKLPIGCSYCPHKFECWKDANDGIGLRTFLYSSGPVHLTKVEREPKVLEITF